MNQQIYNLLKDISTNTKLVNKLIVSLFVDINRLKIRKNNLITSNYIPNSFKTEYKVYKKFSAIYIRQFKSFSFENLIELFEFVISPKDKIINGAVYTPSYIRESIVNECFVNSLDIPNSTFCDMACGCGGFLFTIARKLKKKTGLAYKDIYLRNLYGLDITKYSIERTKIILTLLAISEGEDEKDFKFNLNVGNALKFNWFKNYSKILKSKGFDFVVGNPPYVSSRNISDISKKLLKKWSVCDTGLTDLYIPFFQIGATYLKPKGVLGYITMNTFLKSVNGRALRKYFSTNKFEIKIVDFRGEQIFRNKSTYTCLCFIKNITSSVIYYSKETKKSIQEKKKIKSNPVNFMNLDDHNGWLLGSSALISKINKIENVGTKINDLFKIKNGFATLKNELFVFKPLKVNGKYFIREFNGKKYYIEKELCKNAIKPNILKTESDIPIQKEKLIFPYTVVKDKLIIYNESHMKNRFPKAYSFLTEFKDVLSTRDKGNGDYEKWYAFGRSQSLMNTGYKLLFPYISDKPYFIFTNEKNLFFYNGYAIISESETDLLILKRILESKIFWFYIKNSSKPYSSNYFALAKNYIKNFGIPDLNDKEKKFLLDSKKTEIDNFLMKKYGVSI